MKYLLLILILMPGSFLTACGDNNATPLQTVPSNSGFSQPANANPGVLEEFVSALNSHQLQKAIDLFDDTASFTEINQIYLGTSVPDKGLNYTYSGKAEIASWLEYQVAATLQIVPVEYKLSANSVTLEANFYYTDQVHNIRLDAQTQGGRISSLYFFIEQINSVPVS